MDEQDIFTTVGADGFQRLVAAFYRQVPSDPVLGPMYPESDLDGAEIRLRDFLVFRFGGPPTYLEKRGHPRLRMRHAPFAIDDEARKHWVMLMDRALAEASFPAEAAETLRLFFLSTADFLKNR